MAENATPSPMPKRGGYTGDRPLSSLGPPPRTPSGSVPPSPAKRPKKKSA